MKEKKREEIGWSNVREERCIVVFFKQKTAYEMLRSLVGSVQRVSDIIGGIAAAAGEQSDGISQVNVAVNQLDQMTQQNAALVEQSAAAAESLKDQAARLKEAVAMFQMAA